MAYYQDLDDPYGSYDPQAPLDPYVTEEDSFEFYDAGSEQYGEDGMYVSDGVDDYPEDELEYEYDEMYDEEGDGILYRDDLLFQDDWLPLPPEEIPVETLPVEMRPEDYGSQLLIGGLQHPDPASMRDSYCQFYPEACLEGAGLSGREPFNRTEVAEELDRTLKDVDMTGLAIAAVLILILLFGLHYGGATETPAPTPPPSPGTIIRDRLKEAGLKDPTLAKHVSDIMKKPEGEREKAIDQILADQYKNRLKDTGLIEPKLSEGVKAIMKSPAKEREAKFKELTGTGPATASAEDKLDKKKYDKLLSDAGLRGEARPPKLAEVMAEPADKRQAKCDEIIAALKPGEIPVDPDVEKYTKALEAAGFKGDTLGRRVRRIMAKPPGERDDELAKIIAESKPNPAPVDPDLAKYKGKLSAKGVKEPDLSNQLAEIMAVPAGAREARYKELTKPISTAAVVDPDIAKYTQALQKAGLKEPRLAAKLKEIMDLPAADREAKCKDIIAKEKSDPPPTTDKPMNTAELDAKLKEYIPDDAKRGKAVAALRPKSLAEQQKALDEYKAAKEKSDAAAKATKDAADKGKSEKKKELETKLKDAGVKDPKKLDAEVARLTPMTAEQQTSEIGKIKSSIDAAKAKAAEKEAKETLRKALDTELKEAGYEDDKDREKKVSQLMSMDEATRNTAKKGLIDAKKPKGEGNPSPQAQADTKAAEEAAKATEQAALKAILEDSLKKAGYTDQGEIDRMLKTLMGIKDKKARDAKLEDYMKKAPKPLKADTPPAETPEQKAAKKLEEDNRTRAKLDEKLLGAKYSDKADRDAKVDRIMKIKDPAQREGKLQEYLARPPGSTNGPPALPNPTNPAAPSGPPDPVNPPDTDKKALDKEEIEKRLKTRGFKNPKAIQWMTEAVLAKTTPEDQQKELNKYLSIRSAQRDAAEKEFAKQQEEKDKAAAGVVPGSGKSISSCWPAYTSPADCSRTLGSRFYQTSLRCRFQKETREAQI